jgi:hypothetical protein
MILNAERPALWRLVQRFRLVLLAALLPLAACASFDGQPKAVLSPAVVSTTGYEVPTSLRSYYTQADSNARKNYRNRVIGIYMAAADANFLKFKQLLSRESKGSNFGLGTAIIGLTSAATVSGQRAAQILTAGAAGLTGTQGKLSNEVYFAKTLPALFAGMEANRTRVRTVIVTRMAEADSYTLSEAFSDIASYEEAASIDQSIKTMTAETAQRADQEQTRFEKVVGVGGIVTADARITLRELGNRIDALVPSRGADLIKISQHLGLPTNVDSQDQATNIMTKLQDMAAADPQSLAAFVEAMGTQGVDLTR